MDQASSSEEYCYNIFWALVAGLCILLFITSVLVTELLYSRCEEKRLQEQRATDRAAAATGAALAAAVGTAATSLPPAAVLPRGEHYMAICSPRQVRFNPALSVQYHAAGPEAGEHESFLI
jgi:formate hydrogenlyase subunit 3/multisubunit Na+/H+ antiporter MnhD subunit